MLTNSELETYKKVVRLLVFSPLTFDEKKYLQIFKENIDYGKNFQNSINLLGRAFTTLDNGTYQVGGLTTDAKRFFTEIKIEYGDPKDHQFYRESPSGTVIGGAVGGGGVSHGITKSFLIYYFSVIIVIVLIILYMFKIV
ncbi:MAG: hypothetical protein LBI13_10865 [Streptococcaceae bacterium]|jgi:hypothetical protein|nr:hypothetical protein [Streptococcaceae bacterium]